ncbi:Nramp family divalent metal transporter [Poritiphilus flavus]|uniref:Divalent metal cation transporter n=1 Tax=Poritiphilus flavus TaxID=2697053 RepID=A0A6L9EED3_9FLAO|nr:Nramp family divalent metal transporter [Poritiphilus flavus]NAS13085.1 divalent metal cation transporter [Poritiphilus flavus]
MRTKIGPGILVAAAFIGPGTVTACTLAGVKFGTALLWAMLLSIVATVVLQEMAARLGIITQKGLAGVLKTELTIPWFRSLALLVVLSAIVIGNAAYEAGNIGGATLGLEVFFGQGYRQFYPWIIGLVAFVLLYLSSYKALEKVFVILVGIMSVSFLTTAIITGPDIKKVAQGLFMPEVPEGSLLTIIALVGTTVVPYNLFLHASLVREKWNSAAGLSDARKDTLISVFLGGLVSMAIIVSAAAIPGDQLESVMDLARGLEPLYGDAAKYFMGVGLFAAGVTSAITAPLAAAYVAGSVFGWEKGTKHFKFRLVWILVLISGVSVLSFDINPIQVIKFAQVANGILLPFIAVFLVWMVNKKGIMGNYKNDIWQNILAITILLLATVLGLKSLVQVFGILQ